MKIVHTFWGVLKGYCFEGYEIKTAELLFKPLEGKILTWENPNII
jgi:hypothetical protein